MVGIFGGRGASAVMGLFMLALGSSEAGAQNLTSALNVPAAVRSIEVDRSAKPLGTGTSLVTSATAVASQAVATTAAVTLGNGAILQAAPAQSVTVSLQPSIAREAAWLQQGGWGLAALADRFSAGAPLDEQANCIATAVYFEARGETAEGQLAVAKVVMNRAASGKYPSTWCGTVKQPWQFSFVNPRTGQFPSIDYNSDAWRRALGITRIAVANAVPSLSNDVLWYHADYVAPSWGRRLSMVQKIGAHIFYRA